MNLLGLPRVVCLEQHLVQAALIVKRLVHVSQPTTLGRFGHGVHHISAVPDDGGVDGGGDNDDYDDDEMKRSK